MTPQRPIPLIRLFPAFLPHAATVALVFLTLLVALTVIGLYLYRNRGSYGTGEEEPEPRPEREPPDTGKEEYFI